MLAGKLLLTLLCWATRFSSRRSRTVQIPKAGIIKLMTKGMEDLNQSSDLEQRLQSATIEYPVLKSRKDELKDESKSQNQCGNNNIYEVISRSRYPDPATIPSGRKQDSNTITHIDYIFNPVIGKQAIWQPLGEKLSTNEQQSSTLECIPNESYFSIRLDGKSFSKVLPKLQRLGFLEPKKPTGASGYSSILEDIMKTTALAVAMKTRLLHALYVFTQSDEITVIFDKARLDKNGDLTKKPYRGRVFKYLTHAASVATFTFTKCLLRKLLQMRESDETETAESESSVYAKGRLSKSYDAMMLELPEIVFDARIGIYSTLQDAFELILWRSYDCSVNGLSSAIHCNVHSADKKQVMAMDSTGKLRYLASHGFLPLPDHQVYGSFYQLANVEREVINRETGEPFMKTCQSLTLVPGPVIKNVKDGVIIIPPE